jgi:hypothetical protein
MATLISKPGITNASVLTIPTTWGGTWFRSFVNNQLTGADVRNAIAGAGITISGNLSTPYATISAGGSGAPFNAPIIIKTTGGVTVFEVFNSLTGPTVEAYGPTAGGLVDLTPDTGTFTGTLTGCTTAPTATCYWARVGKLVLLYIPVLTATSNSTACTITGLPAEIQPATLTQNLFIGGIVNNGALVYGTGSITITPGSSAIALFPNGSPGTFTTSGTKGNDFQWTVAYFLT